MIRRRQRGRRSSKWPAIKELRSRYLDAAVRAQLEHGSDGTFYEDEMLLVREQLRADPGVVAALSVAWGACSQGASAITREGYFAMSRRLYLALYAPTAKIDPKDWQR